MKAKKTGKKTPGTVLLADDSTRTRHFLETELKLLGHEVVGAVSNGEDAVEKAAELKPGLVIMDIKMPKMDGIEAARAITAGGAVPIILITGVSTCETASKASEAAIEAGVFAYLVKPVTKKQLEPAIKLAMVRFEQFSKMQTEVDDLKEAIETRKIVERAKGILMKRCNISEEEAFRTLQTHSQKENRKMREIAGNIVSAAKII